MNGRMWSEADLATLKALYPVRPTSELVSVFGRPANQIYAAASSRGLRKSVAFLAGPESGRLRKGECRPGTESTRFQKGALPWNTGLRRPGWSRGRMTATQFRKGQRSGAAAVNWRPVGTILPDAEGYLRVKVRDAVHGVEATGFGNVKVWPLLQRHVWEREKGPIPPGHNIAFLDGDRRNCAIENLECVSRAEMMRRNSMWARYPRELAEVIQLAGALKRKIRRRNGEE